MGRFLTADEKRRALAEWHAAREQHACLTGDRGGRGFPDPDIVPWCDRLNELPGVCTLQSCAGHGSAAAGHVESPGHLWLLLDPMTSAAFDSQAFRLAAETRYIEQVSRLYTPWGKEIASITFAGNERDLLNESMRVVLAFFRSLGAAPRQD